MSTSSRSKHDLTLLELKEMFRLYVKAMQRKLEKRDVDWLVSTRQRSDYFSELMK